ncbi:hypothetical protein LQ327_05470 [Actinomycetospora endophytica]|uniref:Uncharacterized protein n=1 Tax=Actinomycetospora endophytica TaxID=2291215 RepID=A0ABS8P3K8_9PSEU|nr:hypothetical protein [Actinomycetospora endophytica]MCD2192837.1 hypothetical protein [Actinomycetospora endophytica]
MIAADLDDVAGVADAILFEGYLLYPYRASAQKNALRWQFGVLVPAGSGAGEPARSRTECLVEPRRGARLALRLRFLHRQRRTVLDVTGTPCEQLDVDGEPHLRWDEGVPRQIDAEVGLDELREAPAVIAVGIPAGRVREPIRDAGGVRRGTYVRVTEALSGRVIVGLEPVPGPYGAMRLRLDVVNDAESRPGDRDRALDRAFIAAHTVLALDDGAFISATDPPEWAAPAVGACVNEHSWPVLAGPEGCTSLLLATPIILADHPQLAPESPTDLFDGTENDEILTLRTAALTDAEKREARATDPRAADLLDAVEAMGPAMVERLHGVIRPDGRAPDEIPTLTTDQPWWDPGADAAVDPSSDAVLVGDVAVRAGSAVVLWPRSGGDAQDLFLRGRTGVVQAVLHDVDGLVHVAVALDDDPADLQTAHGRFRYFAPDELAVAP